jgi:hypothetical protein
MHYLISSPYQSPVYVLDENGGKFDHVRKSTKVRDFNNIRGYLPIYPVSGETLRFWILNYAGTEASNVVESKWP